VARPSDASSWVAETRFSGVLAELALPRVTVRDLLPPELALERGCGTARTYPLLTMFGEQTGSAVHLASMKVRTGAQFHEVLFGIRCLVARSRTPVLFIPLMYCDEPVSRWSGNALYGFNKRTASMEWLGTSFVVTPRDEGQVAIRVGIDVPASRLARRSWVPRMSGLTLLGRRRDGTYARSAFAWKWSDASVEPIRVVIEIVGGLLPGVGPTTLFPPAGRALCVRDLVWRIGWPRPSSDVENHHDRSPDVMGMRFGA